MVRSDLILSTRFLGPDGGSVRDLAAAVMMVGTHQVGLAPSTAPPDPAGLRSTLAASDLRVACVQCPYTRTSATASLAAAAPAEHARAIEIVHGSMKNATRLGTPVVVVDLGTFEVPDAAERRNQVLRMVEADGLGEPAVTARDALVAEGRKAELAVLERVVRALHGLLKAEPEIELAIATGEPLIGWPSPEMLENLLADLKTSRLGYWHHSGRAAVAERLGLGAEGSLLTAHGPRLAGVTLSDVQGTMDGLPPGAGQVDFRALRSALPQRCRKLVDLDARVGLPGIRLAFDYLRSIGFE